MASSVSGTPFLFNDNSAVVVSELHQLVEHGLRNFTFHQLDVSEYSVRHCLKNNDEGQLRFFALHLWLNRWINAKYPSQQKRLDDYFSNTADEFQQELARAIYENIRFNPKLCAEALLKLPSNILVLVCKDDRVFAVSELLIKYIEASFSQKEELLAKFQAVIPNHADYFYSVMARAHRINYIKECPFYEIYRAAMCELVSKHLEYARSGRSLPLPENPYERKYFIRILFEQNHPYTFVVVSHFQPSDWLEISSDDPLFGKFYENCLCHASLYSGSHPENRERLSKLYEMLTELKHGGNRSFPIYKRQQKDLDEGEESFANNLTPEALTFFSPFFHDRLRHLIISYYSKKDKPKLVAWLMYAAMHFPEGLKELVPETTRFREVFMFLLYDDFSPLHLLILANIEQDLYINNMIVFECPQEKTVPRLKLWIEFLAVNPAVQVSSKLFTGEGGYLKPFLTQGLLVKLRDAIGASDTPARQYIVSAFPPEVFTFDAEQSRLARRDFFVGVIESAGTYWEKTGAIKKYFSDDNPWEMLEWMVERLSHQHKPYLLVFYGYLFSKITYGCVYEINNRPIVAIDKNAPARLLGVDHSSSSTQLFTNESRWVEVMVDLLACHFEHPFSGTELDYEEPEFLQHLYMALYSSNTMPKVFARVRSLVGNDPFKIFIAKFASVTPASPYEILEILDQMGSSSAPTG